MLLFARDEWWCASCEAKPPLFCGRNARCRCTLDGLANLAGLFVPRSRRMCNLHGHRNASTAACGYDARGCTQCMADGSKKKAAQRADQLVAAQSYSMLEQASAQALGIDEPLAEPRYRPSFGVRDVSWGSLLSHEWRYLFHYVQKSYYAEPTNTQWWREQLASLAIRLNLMDAHPDESKTTGAMKVAAYWKFLVQPANLATVASYAYWDQQQEKKVAWARLWQDLVYGDGD